MDEIKYLVYESHLLSLFTQCRSCHQHCSGKIAHQMGSFICVKLECCHCGHIYTWKNQPFVKDTPVANLLLSAAVLFSGSTPGKVLLLLKHLNMASIKERTLFDHQKQYLAPAILSVWNKEQSTLPLCQKSHFLIRII